MTLRRSSLLQDIAPSCHRCMVARWVAWLFLLACLPGVLTAQALRPAPLGKDEIKLYATVHLAIAQAHDSIDAQLAQSRNKTAQAQQQLQERLRAQIADILAKSGLSDSAFKRRRYVVSTDSAARREFDVVVAQLTGAPLPGQLPPRPTVAVPAGAVGTHLGHIVNAFSDTPDGLGLLPAAMAEARVAIQHAELAMRDPGNLNALKLHAGHVIHALDPTIVTTGPGRGYGLKRAATGVATHVELAAKVEGALPSVAMHATHIAAAARAAVTRADVIIGLAKGVQAASASEAAATLMAQIASLCTQVVSGVDANGDGRVTWEQTEGGLQQAQEHVNLLVAAR